LDGEDRGGHLLDALRGEHGTIEQQRRLGPEQEHGAIEQQRRLGLEQEHGHGRRDELGQRGGQP